MKVRVKARSWRALLCTGRCPKDVSSSAVAAAAIHRPQPSLTGAKAAAIDGGPEAGNLTIGPYVGPAAHMAASLRPSGLRLKRVTEEHLELLVGGPVRYEDRAASA